MSGWVWLAVGTGLWVAEAFTLTLALGMLGTGALAAAGAAALGAGDAVEVGVFAAVSVLMLALVRPVARRHVRRGPAAVTGVQALVGRPAVVTGEVTAHAGQVRLNGELWAARGYAGSPALPVGAPVVVASVDGTVVTVYPADLDA